MKIDNIDALKQWLVSVLNPIFDGDPEKLALYIVALAKKIDDDQPSRERCINDLEVFLEAHTLTFVNSLFDTLVSKKYLTAQASTPAPATPAQPADTTKPNPESTEKDRKKDHHDSRYQSERERGKRHEESRRPAGSGRQSGGGDHYYNNRTSAGYRGRLSRDYQEIDVSSSSTGRPMRSRSRSNTNTRHKNRTTRTRTHRAGGGGAMSSSSESSESPSPTRSRRFDGERGNAYRRSRSRSYSRSYSPKNRSAANTEESSTPIKKQRCRDFDEKGICTQAELCPYDHGEVVIAPLMPQGAGPTQPSVAAPAPSQLPSGNNFSIPPPQTNFNNPPNDMYQPLARQQQRIQHHNQQQGNMKQRRNPNINNNKPALLPMPPALQQVPSIGMSPNTGSTQLPVQPQQGRFAKQQGFTNLPNYIQRNPNAGPPQGPTANQPNPNEMGYNPQQRPMNMNRPRNLVNIVTSSIHEEDSSADVAGNNNFQQQRGIKRTYNNSNVKVGASNSNMNFNTNSQPGTISSSDQNFSYQNSNQPNFQSFGQQHQQHHHHHVNHQTEHQTALLPTPVSMQPLAVQQQQSLPLKMPMTGSPAFNPSPSGQQQASMTPTKSPSSLNTTLVLRKVPVELNRYDKMHQHFSQFGQILDIQCHYDQNNDATLVQFATNQQAFAAYKCPQSVLNNRFIRIFWLSNYQKQQQQVGHQQQSQMPSQPPLQQHAPANDEPLLKKPVKERLSFNNSQIQQIEFKNKENKLVKQSPSSVVVATSGGSLTKTVYNTQSETGGEDEETAPTVTPNNTPTNQNLSSNFNSLTIKPGAGAGDENAAATAKSEFATAQAIQDENQKKILLLKMQVKQKARELIEKQIKDQKLLVKKFEQAKTVEEKSQILDLIKKLSQSIEKEKEILNNEKLPLSASASAESGNAENMSSPSAYSTSPFTFQKTGPKPSHVHVIPAPHHLLKLNNKKLNTTNFLKPAAMGVAGGKPASPGIVKENRMLFGTSPASSSPTSNMFGFSKVSVDNRPKQLLITGVENMQEKTAILNFIKAIGCYVESVADLNTGTELISFTINFATRKDAEIALAKCSSSLSSKTISITWSKPAEISQPPPVQKPVVPVKEEAVPVKEEAVTATTTYIVETTRDSIGENTGEGTGVGESGADEAGVDEVLPAGADDFGEAMLDDSAAQKQFVDALFDESTTYENVLS